MSEPIGVLVDRRELRRALAGRPTKERIALYRQIAVEDPEISLVLFPIQGIQIARNRLRAYAPTPNGWRKVVVPIPKVIHKRVIHRSPAAIRTLQRLQDRGVILVNPNGMRNKVHMHALLSQDPDIRDHLPITAPYRHAMLRRLLGRRMSLILKPQLGSAGYGVVRIDPLKRGRTRIMGRGVRTLSRRALRKHLGRQRILRRYLIQQCIDLARHGGKPFDFRVPVQRDATGDWSVPGMVAKVARRHRFLTNMAQGGEAVPGMQMLESVFPGETAKKIAQEIERLAIAVAQAVSKEHSHAADLGLDIGVDAKGKPWLIEVNTRDQRITFAQAGLATAFRDLYRNPLAYCTHLQRVVQEA